MVVVFLADGMCFAVVGQNGQPSAGPAACVSAKYGQCAGKNWNGCKGCAAGSTCRYQNDYYSQCL
jgi:hypothetical protein